MGGGALSPAPRLAVLLAGVLLATVALAGCAFTDGASGDGPYLVLGDPDNGGLKEWPGSFDSPLSAFDFDGDGDQEIVAQNTDTNVYVFDTRSGRALATLPTRYPPAWYIDQVSNGVGVGVLKEGTPPAIVVANHAGYLSLWTYDAAGSDGKRFAFERAWEKRATDCERNPSMDATVTLADLDGDGEQEILIQAEEVGLYAFEADGSLLWSQCWGGGNGSPVAADLDGDGSLEAIFASDAGMISVLDGATGEPRWTFDASDADHGVDPASVTVSPTVAELDGKAPKEILFTARHAPEDDPDRFDEFNMAIFAIHQAEDAWEGELVWMIQPEWANPLSYTPLVVEDVDGDGKADIFGMDWNTIGHRPGEWERLGPGNAFRLSADGDVVWRRAIDAWWSNKAVAIADLDGDGERELVVNGPRGDGDGLYGLSLESGRTVATHDSPGWKHMGGPRFLDLHGDGSGHLVYRVVPDTGSTDKSDKGAILVHDLTGG